MVLPAIRSSEASVNPDRMAEGQPGTERGRHRNHRYLRGPHSLVTFCKARTNRLCIDLFWSHSCKHMIYEDVWRLVPGRFVHHAAAAPACKKPSVCSWLMLPRSNQARLSPSADPLRLFRAAGVLFWDLLTGVVPRMCVILFGIHEPQRSRSVYYTATASWWNLALLISISDWLDAGSFIIQRKSG